MRDDASDARLAVGCCVVLAALVVLLVSGCASGQPQDPFAGTWRVSGTGSSDYVIARAPDGYRVTTVVDGHTIHSIDAKRHGDELRADLRVLNDGQPTGQVITTLIESRPDTGHLIYESGGVRVELERVSGDTAFPSPLPSKR